MLYMPCIIGGGKQIELLKEKTLAEAGLEGGHILKVDSILNHQLDVAFLNEVGNDSKDYLVIKI